MPNNAVPDKKKAFLALFDAVPGSAEWQSKALSDALTSALRRNPTYMPGATTSDRERFRASWRHELTDIADEYVQSMKYRGGFEDDVLRLQEKMNAQSSDLRVMRGPAVRATGRSPIRSRR